MPSSHLRFVSQLPGFPASIHLAILLLWTSAPEFCTSQLYNRLPPIFTLHGQLMSACFTHASQGPYVNLATETHT